MEQHRGVLLLSPPPSIPLMRNVLGLGAGITPRHPRVRGGERQRFPVPRGGVPGIPGVPDLRALPGMGMSPLPRIISVFVSQDRSGKEAVKEEFVQLKIHVVGKDQGREGAGWGRKDQDEEGAGWGGIRMGKEVPGAQVPFLGCF